MSPIDPRTAGSIDVVQALRGVACLLVVCYHARFSIDGPAYLDLGTRAFGSGACGVDLFFIISGFIIVHVTAQLRCTNRDIAQFVVKRWTRVWPPYAIATLLAMCCDPRLHWNAKLAIDVGKALAFYPQHYTGAPFFGWAPLNVGWTLVFEIWFYLLFALSMAARRFRWLALGTLFAATLIALPLLLNGAVSLDAYANFDLRPALLNIATSPLLWEFALGALIALAYRSRFRIANPTAVRVLAASSVVIFVWQVLAGTGRHGVLHWGVPSALLLLSLLLAHKEMPLPVPAWLIWLGDISFSLYLVHLIVQRGLGAALPKLGFSKWRMGFGFFIGSAALSIILAAVSHRFVERRLGARLRRGIKSRLGW